jgi:N-acyl-D-amino-acid deacylase
MPTNGRDRMRMPRRDVRLLGCLLGILALSPARARAQAPEYDIVIRNGRVLDGAGNPWIRADVAIKDGRFVKLGHVTGKGKLEIDATGQYVTPGWIDMMDQSGEALLENGLAENKLQEGVTTAIGGEGGFPVPAESIPDYWARLRRQGISMNFGSYFNEVQTRIPLLGYSAREPTPVELDSMKKIMATAMKNGAMGMSTALIYPPLSYAKTPELVAIAKVAGEYGGFYATHMRDEGKGILSAVHEAIEIGEEGHVPVEIFHLKVAYAPGWGVLMPKLGALVDSARSRGVDIAADMYVYTAGGTGLEATIPAWAHEGGNDSLKARLARPAIRARLKREIVTGSPGWWNIVEASGGWKNIILVNARNDANKKYENKSLLEIGKEMGKSPADAAFDLVSEGHGRVMALYFMMTDKDIRTALQFPWTSIGSDAGASVTRGGVGPTGLTHPRAYGNFPRFLSHYVRDEHLMSLPDAIRKITSWPATRMRLDDRGVIRKGAWADVVVFDYDKLKDRATYKDPLEYPDGIDYVLVNGQVVMDHGHHTGARPGMLLYGPGYEGAR